MASKRPRTFRTEGDDGVDFVTGKIFACIQTLRIVREQLHTDPLSKAPASGIMSKLLDTVMEELHLARNAVPGRILTDRADLSSVE